MNQAHCEDLAVPEAAADLLLDAESDGVDALIQDLRADGLGYRAIATAVDEQLGVSISHMTVQRRLQRLSEADDATEPPPEPETDLDALNAAIAFLRAAVAGSTRTMKGMSPRDRMSCRLRATRDLGAMLRLKVELTGRPITGVAVRMPVEDLRKLASEIYGSAPPVTRNTGPGADNQVQ